MIEPAQHGYGLYREGNTLVAVKGAVFPDRCVKCNAPAEGFRLTRALHWHHPAIFLTVCPGLLVYIILALVLRKSATFQVGVCPEHRRARTVATTAAWLVFLAGMVAMFASIVVESGLLAIVSFFNMLLGIIVGLHKARLIWPKRIDDTHAWIAGAGNDFLISLAPETAGG